MATIKGDVRFGDYTLRMDFNALCDAEEDFPGIMRGEVRLDIRGIALHRRTTSAKGAAFQALVLNLHLSDLLCTGLDTQPTPDQREAMQKSDHQIERGLVSIVHYLADVGGELPAHLVKHYLMAADEQPASSLDRAMAHFRVR